MRGFFSTKDLFFAPRRQNMAQIKRFSSLVDIYVFYTYNAHVMVRCRQERRTGRRNTPAGSEKRTCRPSGKKVSRRSKSFFFFFSPSNSLVVLAGIEKSVSFLLLHAKLPIVVLFQSPLFELRLVLGFLPTPPHFIREFDFLSIAFKDRSSFILIWGIHLMWIEWPHLGSLFHNLLLCVV